MSLLSQTNRSETKQLPTRRSKSRSRRKSELGFEKLEPKRYLASVGWDGAGQGGAELTYYLGDAPAQVDQAVFESAIKQALDVWSDVVDVEFTETSTPGQNDSLDITFASLDGQGGTLARAYFPDDVNPDRIAGDIEFDSSENWEVGNQQGFAATDLLYVAVHEIGHALGLEHSDANNSVLSSTVSPNQEFMTLDEADRQAALALYAPAETDSLPTTPTVPVTPTVPTTPTTTVPTTTPESENPTEEEVPTEPETELEPETPESDSEPETPAEPEDNNRNRRRNRFRRWASHQFRFFNQFVDRFASNDGFNSSNNQVDTPTENSPATVNPQVNFRFRVFRFFR